MLFTNESTFYRGFPHEPIDFELSDPDLGEAAEILHLMFYNFIGLNSEVARELLEL